MKARRRSQAKLRQPVLFPTLTCWMVYLINVKRLHQVWPAIRERVEVSTEDHVLTSTAGDCLGEFIFGISVPNHKGCPYARNVSGRAGIMSFQDHPFQGLSGPERGVAKV